MALNPNIGPERVEVTPKPIGTVLVPGVSTARTCLLIFTTKADAPLNTPTVVTSPSDFEATFGTQAEAGESYLSMQGFYNNAGEGAELVIIAVEPTAVSGSILEVAQNQDARSIVGTIGSLLDDGEIVSDLTMTAYVASTGRVTLALGGATPNSLAKVQVGDFLRDAEGRMFPILSLKGNNKVFIEANLDQELFKSDKGFSAAAATGLSIIRILPDYSGKTNIQEGATYGSGVSVTVSGAVLTLSGFNAYLNDIQSGDIIEDSASEEFIVIEVIDGDNIRVDRDGLTAGVVDIKTGLKNKVVASQSAAGALYLDLAVAPYYAVAGEARFEIADSAVNPPVNSLAGYFIQFDDGEEAVIVDNSIVASETNLVAALVATIAYDAITGVVTLPVGTTAIAAGVKSGDVLIDSLGKEYVIHDVLTEETIRINKNIASPNPLAGAKLNKGAVQLEFASTVDFTLKAIGEANEDTTGQIAFEANEMLFAAGTSILSDDYFIADPAVQEVDYIGNEANLTGLRALDAEDVINLVGIPGVYSPSVQGALIDYCAVTRDDCVALVSIPEFIDSAFVDTLKVSNLSIDTIQNSANGSIVTFIGSPDLSEVSSYDILSIGTQSFTIKAVSDQDSQVLLFATTGVPTVGAVSVSAASAVTWKDTVVNKPTTKAAWYYNHLRVTDTNGSSVIVDPVGHVAGVMARIDANIAQGGVSHAPAGIQLAQIAGIDGLQLQISERKEGGPLRLAYINRITASTGNGNYIFGGYTAGGDSVTPDEKLIQVIRSILFVKGSLEQGLIGFLWENNSPVTAQNVINAELAFLRANAYLFPAGLPENLQFRVIPVAQTQEDRDQGILRSRIQVNFNTAVRFIDIDLEFPIPVEG